MLFKIVIEKTNKYILRIEKIMIQSGIKVTVQPLGMSYHAILRMYGGAERNCYRTWEKG